MRGLHSVPVVAGQAPLALSNAGTQHPALIPSCRQMSAHPAKRACPSVRPLDSFHSKLSCRAGRGSTTYESQDCSVPSALPQSCPKVFGLSAAYGRSPLRSGRCWTRATGTQQPSSYLGVIKCADTGSSKLAPAPAHLIAFIVNDKCLKTK